MLRFVVSAIALAGILAMGHPALADRVADKVSDQAQAAIHASEQPITPVPASSSPQDMPPPASAGIGKDNVPVGFGWG